MERCKTCKWWLTETDPHYWIISEGRGLCMYAMEEAAGNEAAPIRIFPSAGGDPVAMETAPDFGCVQHETGDQA
jgi:hypothetical protein